MPDRPGTLLGVRSMLPPPMAPGPPGPTADPGVPGGIGLAAASPADPSPARDVAASAAAPGVFGRSAAIALTDSWEVPRAAVKRLASPQERVLLNAAGPAVSSSAVPGLRWQVQHLRLGSNT